MLEVGESKIKALENSVSGRGSFLIHRLLLSVVSSHSRRGEGALELLLKGH